jgi:hypothetical protein
MQSHADVLSATCLPNHLSFAHYQQQLQQQQQQPLLQAGRTIYSRQPAHPAPYPQVDASAMPYYRNSPAHQMYTPAYYHQQPSYVPSYASSSASGYEGGVASSSSSTSSPAASYSTLEDDHASTASSHSSHYQQPYSTNVSADLEVEQVLRATSISSASSAPIELQGLVQQESLYGKAPRKARRNTTSSGSGSSGTHTEGSKRSVRQRCDSEVDSDGHSGNSEKGKRFTCPYTGCNKSFSRNFNLSTHYVSDLKGKLAFLC